MQMFFPERKCRMPTSLANLMEPINHEFMGLCAFQRKISLGPIQKLAQTNLQSSGLFSAPNFSACREYQIPGNKLWGKKSGGGGGFVSEQQL